MEGMSRGGRPEGEMEYEGREAEQKEENGLVKRNRHTAEDLREAGSRQPIVVRNADVMRKSTTNSKGRSPKSTKLFPPDSSVSCEYAVVKKVSVRME